MKRNLILLFAILIIGSLQAQTIEKIKRTKEIVVGITGTQPPFSAKTKSGKLVGFDVDLANLLAASLDSKVVFKEMNFSELLPSLASGQIDLVISGMTITPERNMSFAFAGPYLTVGKSILSTERRFIQLPFAQLNSKNYSAATLKGSTSEEFVNDNLPEIALTAVDSYDKAIDMVIMGEVHMMLADYSECAFALIRNPGKGLMIKEKQFELGLIGIALPADDLLFLNLIDNYIKTMEQSGKLKNLEDKWFRTGGWLDELE